jgi:hypothetical protein
MAPALHKNKNTIYNDIGISLSLATEADTCWEHVVEH